MNEVVRPKRRFLQFRLRTLLIAVLVLSLPLSWFAVKMERARRQREAVEVIERLGEISSKQDCEPQSQDGLDSLTNECSNMRYLLMPSTVLFLMVAAVHADGMMTARVGQSVSLVQSPKQEALIIVNEHTDEIKVSIRTHFRNGPTDLAWVIPVPAIPESVEEGSEDIFRKLEEETAPVFWVSKRSYLKCGCGAGESLPVRQAVDVVDAGIAGIFDYVVLSASDSVSLEDWLSDNKYRIPSNASPVFRRYVDLGWNWLAIRVRTEVQSQPNLAPHPISYKYRGMNVTYPLAISQLSATDEIEMVLYVLAEHRYGGKNWRNTVLDSEVFSLDSTSPSGTTYESIFRQRTTENGGHLLVTEFAHDLDNIGQRWLLAVLWGLDSEDYVLKRRGNPSYCYLTRLRAIVNKDSLDRDVVLVPASVGGSVFSRYDIQAEGDAGWGITVAFVAMFVAVYFRLWTRRCR